MEAEELTERITLPVGWGITAAAIAPVLAAGSAGTASPSESLQSQAVYSMPTETEGTSIQITVVAVAPTQLPYSQFSKIDAHEPQTESQGDDMDYDFGDPDPVEVRGTWFRSLQTAQVETRVADVFSTDEDLILA